MEHQVITKNVRETRKTGAEFARCLRKGKVVCLLGELGSGKTTFVQGMGKKLKIRDTVNSPTFNILKVYPVEDRRAKRFYHVDCYRLKEARELEELGFREWVSDKEGIVVIEWADRVIKVLPEDRIEISFEAIGGGERKIVIRNS